MKSSFCAFLFHKYQFLKDGTPTSTCWPFVTEDDGSKDTLHYKLAVSWFKCEDWCPDSIRTFKLDIRNPMGSKARHDWRISSPGLWAGLWLYAKQLNRHRLRHQHTDAAYLNSMKLTKYSFIPSASLNHGFSYCSFICCMLKKITLNLSMNIKLIFWNTLTVHCQSFIVLTFDIKKCCQ